MTNEIRPPAVFVPPWLKPVGKQGSEESGKQFRKQLADAFKEDEEEKPSSEGTAKAEPEKQEDTPPQDEKQNGADAHPAWEAGLWCALDKWKEDVLGFRDEMRKAEEAEIDALRQILTLLGKNKEEKKP